MNILKPIQSITLALALALLAGCEGGDLYNVNAPDWLSDKIQEIEDSKKPPEEEELEGMLEDVYTIGQTDYNTGWWTALSKYYVVPDGEKWNAIINLHINPADNTYFKNFALIVTNDADRGTAEYTEYGAIRFDATNDSVAYNSQWGTHLYFKYSTSTLLMDPVDNIDANVQRLGGKITLTVDRTDPAAFTIKMANSEATKTYAQPYKEANLNADAGNTNIRCFLVPEGSYIDFQQTNIVPIGGLTSALDKAPLSMTLQGVPAQVAEGTTLEEVVADVSALVTFEEGVTKTVPAAELYFTAIPDLAQPGAKTLVAVYNKTFKGENSDQPVVANAAFEVVKEIISLEVTNSAPTVGATDNSTDFFGATSDDFKVPAGETRYIRFTNYTSGEGNWLNFLVVLRKADLTEYAVVRADNYGWGSGYDACVHAGTQGDWAAWLEGMNGARVTVTVTNNGNGTADVQAVMEGTTGTTSTQYYRGIDTIDADDLYFALTVEKSHIVF